VQPVSWDASSDVGQKQHQKTQAVLRGQAALTGAGFTSVVHVMVQCMHIQAKEADAHVWLDTSSADEQWLIDVPRLGVLALLVGSPSSSAVPVVKVMVQQCMQA
jgi:hypothetical protein